MDSFFVNMVQLILAVMFSLYLNAILPRLSVLLIYGNKAHFTEILGF